jgi:nucleoside-diphosphate-sugar epimerase
LPVDEAHPSTPQDSYGLSKVLGEQIADSIVSVQRGMTVSSLRFPGVNFDLSYESFRDRWRNPATRASGFWTYIDARDAAMTCPWHWKRSSPATKCSSPRQRKTA